MNVPDADSRRAARISKAVSVCGEPGGTGRYRQLVPGAEISTVPKTQAIVRKRPALAAEISVA